MLQTYIVYMGEYPKDMEITDSFHTSMVQSVLGRLITLNCFYSTHLIDFHSKLRLSLILSKKRTIILF